MAEDKVNMRDIQKQVFAQCLSSPEFFIQKFVFIKMTEGGRGKFNLYIFQKKLLNLIHTKDRLIVLKSRQLGITTLCAAYALWLIVFKKDQSVLALAPDQEKARSILDKIAFAYDELPLWLLKMANAEAKEKNKLRITLNNGSVAVAASGAAKSARGKTATFLVIDEAAFIENADELWASAQQTLSTGGSSVVLSTPFGASGWFFDMWENAQTRFNEFIPVVLKWNVHPDRDQAWRDRQDDELGIKLALQECDAQFNRSGDTFFEPDDIILFESELRDPVEMLGTASEMWRWKHPYECGNCVTVVDTSRGDGKDSSAIQVIDLNTGEQVLEWKGLLEPRDLGTYAVRIAIEYNKALLVIENTGLGGTTCSYAKDAGYSNIFYSLKSDTTNMLAYSEFLDEDKMTIGFTMSTKTRPLVLNSIKQSMLDKAIIVRSKRTYSEIKTFIWKLGKAQAQSGRNDDLFMCLAISSYLRDTAMQQKEQGVEMQRAVLGGIRKTQYSAVYVPKTQFENPYHIRNPYDESIEDISWMAR